MDRHGAWSSSVRGGMIRPPRLLVLAGALLVGSFAGTALAAPGGGVGGGPGFPPMPPGVPGVDELGGPFQPLTLSELRLWLRGRLLFDRDFNALDGVGTPEMNADSCRACHQDPVMGGAGPLELNVSRFANDNGGLGPFTDLPGGQAASKLRPTPINTRENYPVGHPDPTANADVFEQRQTPTTFGLGLIEMIPDEEILKHEDPDDLDGDGIRGVARIIMVDGKPEIGRFGWKAQIPRVSDFVRDAMGGELGITTPDDGRGFAFVSDDDDVPDPELTPLNTNAVAFFLFMLAPPPQISSNDPLVVQGKDIFKAIKCNGCHVPSLKGGPDGRVKLFSDLLLHDVQQPGFRGMSEPGAPSGMYRTPPLWGVRDTAPYMHDGRAETLHDAIVMHAGEASFSSAAYNALDVIEQQALVEYLKTL